MSVKESDNDMRGPAVILADKGIKNNSLWKSRGYGYMNDSFLLLSAMFPEKQRGHNHYNHFLTTTDVATGKRQQLIIAPLYPGQAASGAQAWRRMNRTKIQLADHDEVVGTDNCGTVAGTPLILQDYEGGVPEDDCNQCWRLVGACYEYEPWLGNMSGPLPYC